MIFIFVSVGKKRLSKNVEERKYLKRRLLRLQMKQKYETAFKPLVIYLKAKLNLRR